MPASTQLLSDEERGPISPANPDAGVHESEGGEEEFLVRAVRTSKERVNAVRLLPSGAQERKLMRLADLSAKLWNELNYERRQQWNGGQRVDLEGTWRKYREKYKGALGPHNADAVINKNNEAWGSFFSLLKAKKEGKLPKHWRVSPPGYWKDREEGRRRLIFVVAGDSYAVDEVNHIVRINLGKKKRPLEIPFAGRLRWYGKQGRMEIHYDGARRAWHAYISVKVGAETTRNKKPARRIVRGERKSIRIAEPRGNEAAGVDLGINILASAVTSTGAWLLYRGSRAKEDFFYLNKEIAEVQSKADSARNAGDTEEFLRQNRRRRRLFRKLARRMAHLYWNLANHLVRGLWELGVSRIYLGYPRDIAQDKGNKLTTNMWRYRELMDAIELKAQEYGIRVYEVVEYDTSNHCAVHGAEVTRGPRGVVRCPLGHRLHSDLNGALNILRRGAGSIPATIKKPLSFLVDHGGVAPVKGA
ncbi:MAG: transposase [Candidatus Nanopusillus sp.]